MQLPNSVVILFRYLGSLILLAFVAALMGVAAIPAGWLFVHAYARFGWIGAAASAPFAYAIWGVSYCLLVIAYKWLTLYRAKAGEFPFFTLQVIQWAITGKLHDIACVVFVQFLGGTPYVV